MEATVAPIPIVWNNHVNPSMDLLFDVSNMAAELDYLEQRGMKIIHCINERRELSWNLLCHSVDEKIMDFHSYKMPVYVNP